MTKLNIHNEQSFNVAIQLVTGIDPSKGWTLELIQIDNITPVIIRCSCGWKGDQKLLEDKKCPECHAEFVPYPNIGNICA